MLDIFLEEGHIIILNSFTKTVLGWGWSWWLIPLFLGMLAGIVALKIAFNTFDNEWVIIGCGCIILLAILGIAIASQAKEVATYEVYELVMDDHVPFKEFNEVCEVIDQRGDIYTVKMRD